MSKKDSRWPQGVATSSVQATNWNQNFVITRKSKTLFSNNIFCSTSLPLAITRWVQLTLSNLCRLFQAVLSIKLSSSLKNNFEKSRLNKSSSLFTLDEDSCTANIKFVYRSDRWGLQCSLWRRNGFNYEAIVTLWRHGPSFTVFQVVVVAHQTLFVCFVSAEIKQK